MKILIVDDLTENRYMLESLLKGFGYEAVTARNGVEALTRLKDDGVEMIISDIMMPKMEGFELCRRCKEDERLRKIPFIFYTATFTEEKDIEFGLSLGASRYILKPKEPEAFIEDIREVLAEAEWIDVAKGPTKGGEELEAMHSEVLSRKLEKKVADLEEERVALRESEATMRAVLDTTLYGAVMIDRDARITYWNPGAEKIFGYRAEEVVGESMVSLIVPEKRHEEISRGFANFRKTGEGPLVGETVEMTGKRKDGTEFPMEHSISAVRLKGKWCAVGIIKDITERKRTDEAIKESGERFRGTFEQAAVGIAHVGTNGKWLRVNQKICDIVGYTREEMLKKTFQEITHPDDIEADLNYVRQMLAGEISTYSMEKRYIRKNGSIVWINLTVSLVKEASGEPKYFISVVEDISERKQAEEMLKENEARFKTLASNIPGATYRCAMDRYWTMQYISDGITPITGYQADDFIGNRVRTYSNIIHSDDLKLVDDTVRLAVGKRESYTIEYRVRHADGGVRWVYERGRGVFDKDGNVLWLDGAIFDVTERKEAEERLRKSEEKFRHLYETMNLGTAVCEVIKDMNGNPVDYRFLDINRRYTELTGLTREMTIGNTALEINPNIEQYWIDNIGMVAVTGKPTYYENYYAENDKYYSLYAYCPAKNQFACLVSDITEHRRAEEKIHEEVELNRNLLELSEATAQTTDVEKLMGEVVVCVKSILGTDCCLSYLWEKEAGGLNAGACAGLKHKVISFFKTKVISEDATLIKMALDTRLPVVMSLASDDGRVRIEELGLDELETDINSIIILPLIGRSAPLGLIVCIYRQKNARSAGDLTDRDMVLMVGIVNQVSTALEEAQNYKKLTNKTMELSHKIETIQTMSEISKSILSTLDVNDILEVAARMVYRLAPCDWVRVIDVDRARAELKLMAGFEEGGTVDSSKIPFTSTSLIDVIHTMRPQYIPDLGAIDGPLEVEERLFKSGYRSVLRIPIIVKNTVAGVLGIMSMRVSAFSPEDLSTLEKLSEQIGVALENARLVTDLEELFLGTVRTLSDAIDAKSAWTKGHSDRVTEYALKIASELGWDKEELKILELTGLLHDVGKLGTYESILNKPGNLTDEELELIRNHPVKGAEILSHIKQLKSIIPGLLHHHEFYNGNGYPEGLKGEKIPIMARVLAVADTVDAMEADRPYRKGMPMKTIIEELKRCSGTQFDPAVVEAFLKTL